MSDGIVTNCDDSNDNTEKVLTPITCSNCGTKICNATTADGRQIVIHYSDCTPLPGYDISCVDLPQGHDLCTIDHVDNLEELIEAVKGSEITIESVINCGCEEEGYEPY